MSAFRTLILILLFLGLSAWFVGSSKTFQSCANEQKHEKAEQSSKERLAQVTGILSNNIGCAGEFIHKNGEAIIAIFTVILGIATILLWGATRDLVNEARETSLRQLRAYLSINPTFIEDYGTKKRATINWRVRNHGQTPASDIDYKFTVEVLSDPLPEGFEFPPPQTDLTPKSSLFPSAGDPNHGLVVWFHNDRPFTDEEFDSVEAGTHRIHIWGFMTYKDAFAKIRMTEFNTSVGGPAFKETMRQIRAGKQNPGPGYLWAYAKHHNKST